MIRNLLNDEKEALFFNPYEKIKEPKIKGSEDIWIINIYIYCTTDIT